MLGSVPSCVSGLVAPVHFGLPVAAYKSRPQEGPYMWMRLVEGGGSSSGRADLEDGKGRLKGSSAGKAVFEDERGM